MSKRLAVLVSGGGTNLQAIIDAIDRLEIDATICLVLSSNSKAYALERAKTKGIPTAVLPRKKFNTVEACDLARHEAIMAAKPDIIVLAGFLGILLPETVAAFPNKILNTHPALLPSFGGKGMYGRNVHEAVLNYGCKISGATVHLVDEQVDTGPIVMQGAVPVMQGDTADTLAARVLKVEHMILVKSVALMCQDRIRVENRRVIVEKEAISQWLNVH